MPGVMARAAEKMNSSKTESKATCDNEGGASAVQALHFVLLFSDSFSCHRNCELCWNSADVLCCQGFDSISILLELYSREEANTLVIPTVIS